ncbi:hypothetical protein D3C86_1886880 [compost metagenome]
MPALEDSAALLGGACAPGRPGGGRGGNRAPGFRGAHIRHAADAGAIGRVEDFLGGGVLGVTPLAVDEGLLAEQLRGCWGHGGSGEEKRAAAKAHGRRPKKSLFGAGAQAIVGRAPNLPR